MACLWYPAKDRSIVRGKKNDNNLQWVHFYTTNKLQIHENFTNQLSSSSFDFSGIKISRCIRSYVGSEEYCPKPWPHVHQIQEQHSKHYLKILNAVELINAFCLKFSNSLYKRDKY